jgi:hypothetical protein
MKKLEGFQRGLAALLGLVASWRMVHGTLHDPEPRAQFLAVIVFRFAFIGFIFFLFARRAAGKKMDAISWAVFALLFLDGTWKATSMLGSTIAAICVGLSIVGGVIERRLDAAQPAVAADGASPRR